MPKCDRGIDGVAFNLAGRGHFRADFAFSGRCQDDPEGRIGVVAFRDGTLRLGWMGTRTLSWARLSIPGPGTSAWRLLLDHRLARLVLVDGCRFCWPCGGIGA